MAPCPFLGGGNPVSTPMSLSGGGGTPIPDNGYHGKVRMGSTPLPGLNRVPPSQATEQQRSTYYAVGGMPLAFTQEDFLVRK